ncbi:MAG TPA: EI24 domain-containing protein [Rhodospirillales bacterium]|nr:EI24 domain-containing protein [Rhodospirillales bacterium]
MLDAFAKSIRQLGDPAIRRALLTSIGLSLLIFVLLWVAVGWALTHFAVFQTGWLDAAIDVLGGVATLAVSWFLFPAVVSTTTGFLLDGVAAAVERRHYPALPPARVQPLAEVLLSSAKFFATMLLLNIGMLLFLLVPPVFPFVFYGVNGYLLGREYFEVAAARRLDPVAARALRKRNARTVFAAGVLLALLLTVPVVNLLAPLLGTAAMVHLFMTMQRRA